MSVRKAVAFALLVLFGVTMNAAQAQSEESLPMSNPSSAAEVMYPVQEISQASPDLIPYETDAIVDSLVMNYREAQDLGGADGLSDKIISDLSRLPDESDGKWNGHVNSVVFKDYDANAFLTLQQTDFASLQSRLSNITAYVDEVTVDGGFFSDKVRNTNLIEDMAQSSGSLGFLEAVPDSLFFNLRHNLTGNIVVPNSIIIPIWLKAAHEHFALAVAKNSQAEFGRGMRLIDTIEWQIKNKPEGHLLDVDDSGPSLRNSGFAEFLPQQSPASAVASFADDIMGDIIRSQMESEFGKEIFRAYWDGKTDQVNLSPEEFARIVQAVQNLGYSEQAVVLADGTMGTRRDYSLKDNFEYSKPIGSVAIYYDRNGQPIGLYDTFDFNWKWQGRDCWAETQNRLVDIAGKTFDAKSFPIVYGKIEENPERAEPWYNRGPLPYISIPDDCMAEASQALFPELWPAPPPQNGGGSW